MFTKLIALAGLVLLLFTLSISCKKDVKENQPSQKELLSGNEAHGGGEDQPCIEELDPDWYPDSLMTPTILGRRLSGNPYSVANMQQASINLYGNANGIAVNKWYIRFRPVDENQVKQLSECGIDVFDYPLDREVLEDGDYYPQEGIGENEIPYYYAVVDPGYQAPSGMHYELLQELYVPDQNILLEDEALKITGNPVEDTCNNTFYKEIVPCEADPCRPGCPILDPNPCDGGGGGGGGTTTDPRRPAGNITVTDNTLHRDDIPVKRVRVVCKRYFKIDPVYTDDHGYFQSNKRFKNKVNIIVKFLNNNTIVSGLRGLKVWQMFFPIKKGIGIYSGALNNIAYVFHDAPNQPNSRRNRNWWACHFINSRLEYNDMASAELIGITPDFLRVLLSGWASTRGTGSTPMNGHRITPTISSTFINVFIVNPTTAARALINNAILNGIFIRHLDMTFGYDFPEVSDNLKETMFHELTHSAHFEKVGENWWNDFVYGEVYESARFGVNGAATPYGVGDDGQISDQIALGESWAEHIGRWMSDNWYHASSTNQFNQGILYRNGDLIDGGFTFVTGLDAHINLLEDFSPARTVDVFRWIPYGLYYDIMDNRNDFAFGRLNLFDDVTGYTNRQFFGALEQDIRNLGDYRVRLLNQNGNNQAVGVTSIFNFYGY